MKQNFPNLTVDMQKALYQRWIEGANHPEDKSWREGLRPEEQAFLSFLDSGVPVVADAVAKGTFDQIRMASQKDGDRLDQIFQDIGAQMDDSNDGNNASPTTPIFLDANHYRKGVVFGAEGHGKPVAEKLRMFALIQDYGTPGCELFKMG